MSNKLKILCVVTQSEWGGAGRYVFDLATNLPKDQFEVAVAAGGKKELFDNLEKNHIQTFHLINLVREINPFSDIKAYFEIKKLIKQWQPDIIHLNSSKAGVIGALSAKACKVKKIIYTAHGFVFNEPLSTWKKKLYIFLERFTAKSKDTIICVSEFDRQTGLKNKITTENKLVTIHNGIGQINFLDKETARKELNLPPEKFVIGTIANFYATKGFDYLLQAAAEVIKNKPETIFQLIGFGDLEDFIRLQIIKLNIENNFFVLNGKTMNGAGSKYLKAFNAFALSSVKEGLPYTIIEAMQAGLPIVATKVGGIPEILNENNGLLVPAKDSSALAQAILKIIDDKKLAETLGKNAENDAKSDLSLTKMIQETKNIYK